MTQQEPKQNPKFLSLTNKTLRVGSQIYQLRNITNLDIVRVKPNYIVTLQAILVLFFVGSFLFVLEFEMIQILGLLAWIIALTGIVERIFKKRRYGLLMETNAASKTLVSSPDKDFMQKLIGKIYEVMNNEDIAASYVFNMQDKSIKIGGDAINSDLTTGDY